jgi:glucose/arabinose dehydrogenase
MPGSRDPARQLTRSRLTYRLVAAWLLSALSITGLSAGASGAQAPALTLEPFAAGLQEPVLVTGDGSGRLYAVEQAGFIRLLSAEGEVRDEPFLDITDRVLAGGERGLLGLAFHPDFAANGRLFVDYTRVDDGATVIAEFRAGGRTADPASERTLLVIPQPHANHNGGMIAFDRQGMLLVGMGDGGGAGDPEGNAQDPHALLGKLLRIDVDGDVPYAIPADNPFADGTTAAPEIWALGLRNPWRFSVDRETGDVWIGDVGQGGWEEVDVIPAGQGGLDLGWDIMEGRACYESAGCDSEGLTMPVATLGHDTGVCSVVGGYVYRGARFPALEGSYVFSDYCSGDLWLLRAADGVAGADVKAMLAGTHDGRVVAFGEDDDGELYVVDHGGTILRLEAGADVAD